MSDVKLLPCKFCEGDAQLKSVFFDENYVECLSCHATTAFFETADEARDAWDGGSLIRCLTS
jgi:hypothetical protein